MKPRSFAAAIALVTTGALVLLGACASEVLPPRPTSDVADAAEASAEPDAVADAGASPCVDCEYFPETCSPDVLCLDGPFDPNRPQGDAETFDLRTRINVIVGRGESDVWAAGTAGALAHFDGASWRRSGPDTKETLKGLALLDDGELAFGSKMHRVFLRGIDLPDAAVTEWTSSQNIPTPAEYDRITAYMFTSAWRGRGSQWTWCGSSISDTRPTSVTGLWRLRRLPDATFELQPGTTCGDHCASDGIASIHGSSPNILWAVGSGGSAFRIDGADGDSPTVEAINSQTWNQLNGVWAVSDSEAWAVGVGGTVRHYVAGTPRAEIVPGVPPNVNLRAVWGSSSSDIWAVGDAGVVLRYDGHTWSRVKIAGLAMRRPNLTSVWMPSPGHVWIGGEGLILSLGGRS